MDELRSMINDYIEEMQELGISAIALSIDSELTELLESFCKTDASHIGFKKNCINVYMCVPLDTKNI